MKNCLKLTFNSGQTALAIRVVIAGSGRTADILANALRGDATDERAKKLAKFGILQYIDLIDIEKGVENLGKIIKDLLSS